MPSKRKPVVGQTTIGSYFALQNSMWNMMPQMQALAQQMGMMPPGPFGMQPSFCMQLGLGMQQQLMPEGVVNIGPMGNVAPPAPPPETPGCASHAASRDRSRSPKDARIFKFQDDNAKSSAYRHLGMLWKVGKNACTPQNFRNSCIAISIV